MKKTIKSALLACLILIVSALMFTACSDKNNTHTHTWSEWITIKEAECETSGLLQRYCIECNYTESKPINAFGHTEIIDKAVEPTATENGLTEGKRCLVCGVILVKQEIMPALGYSGLAYEVNADGKTCTITGIGACTDKDIHIVNYIDGYKVTAIGNRAFYACDNLVNVTIENNVTSIGEFAFSDCTGLTSITIPDSITYIGWLAFRGCTGLTNITVSNENKVYQSIGNCLIQKSTKNLIVGCQNSVIPTDGSVTAIYSYAFYNCTGLTSITISQHITFISDAAFYGCTGLTSITIPNSIKRINNGTFYGCTGLTNISIPNSVTLIAFDAFNGCTNLANITFDGTVEKWNAIGKPNSWDYNTGNYTIYCTDGTISKQ